MSKGESVLRGGVCPVTETFEPYPVVVSQPIYTDRLTFGGRWERKHQQPTGATISRDVARREANELWVFSLKDYHLAMSVIPNTMTS